MKRSRPILPLCLIALLLVVSCRNENTPPPTAAPPTDTPAAERGEDSSGPAATAGPTQAPAADSSGAADGAGIIYSIPFEVRPDGFGFRNYGAAYPEGDFTIADLWAQFGDGVCSRIDEDGEVCIPTAEAQQWIDDRNADMRSGHCIGFTVTSYRFTQGDMRPAAFAPDADAPYDIDRGVPIMRAIAVNGSLYWVKSVWSSEVSGTPSDIIDALLALRDPVDLSIFLPGLVGGHSLLAYGVEEVAPGQYHILVYDNNFPGEEAFIEVGYEANTWRYAQGAVNPDQAALPYEGDATTETLRFIPLSAYETATCPFCPPEAEEEEAGEAITLLSLLGQGEVLVETALGEISLAAGEIVNEIPGARLIFQRGQLSADDTPDVVLPAGTDFTLKFNGLQRVSGLSPNLSLAVDHLTPSTRDNRLTVNQKGQGVDFEAGGQQTPILNVTIRQEDTAYRVTLLGVDFADGQGLSVGAAESGPGLELRSRKADVADATLLITRLSDEGEAIFATTSLDIQEGGGVALDVAAWDGDSAIDLYADPEGTGSYGDQPRQLANQPLNEVLQQSDAAEVADIIDNLSPFLGADGLETLLAGLAEQGLSGRELGEFLQPLGLTDEQLIDLIPTFSLTTPELAELLFALRLEPERLSAVIEGLELAEEDVTALAIYLDELALFHEIISDWAFLNTDDLSQLAGLLNARGLTADQIARLLVRMALSETEIERVLSDLRLSTPALTAVAEQLEVNAPTVLTATPVAAVALTGTVTATLTITGTSTLTATLTPTVTATPTIGGTPDGTTTPDPYPGALPLPTGTPDSYPYPGPDPSPTGSPQPYPVGSTTPEFQSSAFCAGDDLRIIAEEPTWEDETIIEVWAGEDLLFSGEIGPDGEAFEATAPGPGIWEDLRIEASVEPLRVPLGTITCPARQ